MKPSRIFETKRLSRSDSNGSRARDAQCLCSASAVFLKARRNCRELTLIGAFALHRLPAWLDPVVMPISNSNAIQLRTLRLVSIRVRNAAKCLELSPCGFRRSQHEHDSAPDNDTSANTKQPVVGLRHNQQDKN